MLLRDWGPRRLLASWVAYGVALGGVALLPLLGRWWALQRSDAHGSISLSFSLSGVQTALLFFGPPLVLSLLWLRARPRRDATPVSGGAPRRRPTAL